MIGRTLVKEDPTNRNKSCNPIASYLNARSRDAEAREVNPGFDTDAHVDRVVEAIDILKKFFGRAPSYITARGLGGRKPFESIKYSDVGYILNRKTATEKNDQLYAPLLKMGNVDVVNRNGHLLVKVFC